MQRAKRKNYEVNIHSRATQHWNTGRTTGVGQFWPNLMGLNQVQISNIWARWVLTLGDGLGLRIVKAQSLWLTQHNLLFYSFYIFQSYIYKWITLILNSFFHYINSVIFFYKSNMTKMVLLMKFFYEIVNYSFTSSLINFQGKLYLYWK